MSAASSSPRSGRSDDCAAAKPRVVTTVTGVPRELVEQHDRDQGRLRRFWIAGIPWAAVAPALWVGWLPWWYCAPLFVAFTVTEALAEQVGRRG